MNTSTTTTLAKVRASQVDCVAHSSLNTARSLKADAWKRVKQLRQKIRDNALGNSGYRLELLHAESNHREILRMESSALFAIEKRANELGQTIR